MQAITSILQLLQNRGVGVRGTTLFMGTSADLPNSGTIITVTDTGGRRPQDTHNSGSLRQPSFQIVARSQDYRLAAAKIEQAYMAITGNGSTILPVVNMLIEGVFWLSISVMSEPFTLSLDASGRSRVAFNIETVRR